MIEHTPHINPLKPDSGYNRKQKVAFAVLLNPIIRFIMFWGGSRSGKTQLAIWYIRLRCLAYPGSRHLVARYAFATAKRTVWLTTMLPQFREDERAGLCTIKTQAGIVEYHNGSTVILGGLEPNRIDGVLGAEYATVFVTEANENGYDAMEKLFSRLNDTSTHFKTGKTIVPKFICDLNPTVETNWTNVLFILGQDPVTREAKRNFSEFANVHFSPEDNEENLSAGYIDSLKDMSPGNRKRFYEGRFGTYEGLVFPISQDHICEPFNIPSHWPRYRSIDFGYTHPFVCLWWALDPSNERVYVYREYVKTRATVNQHARVILHFTKTDFPGAPIEKKYVTAADHDAEDRATLAEHGIDSKPANKEVLAGIDHVVDLLRNDKEVKTRVKIFRSCTSLINGLGSYRYKDNATKDREVLKEDDDEADAFRYGLMEIFKIRNRPMKSFGGRRVY